MEDIPFKGHLIHQKKTISSIFSHTHKFLNYSSKNKSVIIEDRTISRKEWEPYYAYLSCLNYWRTSLDNFVKYLQRENNEGLNGNGAAQKGTFLSDK
jgi:hypothetical protein